MPLGSNRIAPDLRDFPLVPCTGLALPIWFTGPFPFHSVSTPPGCHSYLSSASSHNPVTLLGCPRLMPGSSGFSPPPCYQASQALSPQYYTQICHPLPLSQSGSLPSRVRFMTPPETIGARTGGLPRVRSHRLPISRPTSPRFGSPDIRTRSRTPARPPPRSHLVGSLFATYIGSASCFLQTPISGRALALLALPFRPVTAGCYFFGACVMPGARFCLAGRYPPNQKPSWPQKHTPTSISELFMESMALILKACLPAGREIVPLW